MVKKAAKPVTKKTAKKVVKKAVIKSAKKVAKKIAPAVSPKSETKKGSASTIEKKTKKATQKTAASKSSRNISIKKKEVKEKVLRKTSVTDKSVKGASNKNTGKPRKQGELVSKKDKAASDKKTKKILNQTDEKVAVKANVVKEKKITEVDYNDPDDSVVASSTAGPLEFLPYEVNSKEDYMSNDQINHFKAILGNWRTQLMAEVDSTVGHLQHDAEAYADPLDRAAQEEGFNLELRTRDRERKLIKKIEQALDWIEEGVYGYCEDCGAEIGVRRLEARPTAAKCIDCKTYSEIREKQTGR